MPIILAAAFLRLYKLHVFPVGFHFDEAANVIDLRRIGWSFHPIYFTANNGREPLYFYWAALFVKALGDVPFAPRLASAFMGIATIPAVYFCIGQMLRKTEGTAMARRVALFAAAGCAFLFFHLNFSRIGLRTISLPLVECIAFGLLWRAYRLGRNIDFVLAGFALGLTLYTYTAARLLLPALLAYGLYWLAGRRPIMRPAGLAAASAAFVVTCLPLASYALRQPAEFFQRTQGVAVLNSSEILANIRSILAMFFIRGSINGAHNIIGMPLFDWPMRVAFAAGLILLVPRLRHPAYVFSLLWLIFITFASVFSPDAPYYVRLTALIPPAVLVPALALAWLPDRLNAFTAAFWPSTLSSNAVRADRAIGRDDVVQGPERAIGRQGLPVWVFVPSIAAVLASGLIAYHNYFDVWGPSNDTYFWMMQDKVDGAAALMRWVNKGDQVFLAPLYAQDWTYKALTEDKPIQSFDVKYCLALPSRGRDVVYAFPPYDVTQPDALLARLAGIRPGSGVQSGDQSLAAKATVGPVLNGLLQPVLMSVRLPGADLLSNSDRLVGNFAGQLGLVRVDGLPQTPVRAGTTLDVVLLWQTLESTHDNYTVFIHADEIDHRRRIQQDSMPCGGTFSTNQWRPGEQVFDRHELQIPRDAPAGTYRVTVGLYTLPGPQNLPLAGTQTTDLDVGSFTVQ